MSFDVPYPPNYGGVMDVFYKLKYLKKLGVKIHLHCFTYGRQEANELLDYCETVRYYKRSIGFLSHLSLLPYTVKSRQSNELRTYLLKDNHPILFEVLHTTLLMRDTAFEKRIKIYRHSNIEHEYYRGLALSETNWIKRFYLSLEAIKLKWFEKTIKHSSLILAVNQKDKDYFIKNYPKVKTSFLPSFHPNEEVQKNEVEAYILFHGNLSVSENHQALLWLLNNVFSQVTYRIVIAGLKPSIALKKTLASYNHIQLIDSPDEEQMMLLLKHAKIHVLYTHQGTGLKLKLLNVLYTGNFVLCNSLMLEGTGILPNSSLRIANTASEFITEINLCMKDEINLENIGERRVVLNNFDNSINAQKLIEAVNSVSF